MKELDQVIREVVAHEIGHLLIDMIIEDEYEEYQIQGLNIFYYPKYNTREYSTYKVISGSIKYQDKNIKSFEELVNEGKPLKIKLTEISLLFGCYFQSQFARTHFNDLFSPYDYGYDDRQNFIKICRLRGFKFSTYYNETNFVEYFEEISLKLKEELHSEIIEISNEIFKQYKQLGQLNRIDTVGFSIQENLHSLKYKIKSLEIYKEFVEAVKSYSFTLH